MRGLLIHSRFPTAGGLLRWVLLAHLGVFCHAGSVVADTLREVVRDVIASNPEVLAGAYNTLAREQEVRQARADNRPRVDLNAGIGRQKIYAPFDSDLTREELSLRLRQNVFTGFSTRHEIARQQERVRSAAFRLRAIAENNALTAVSAYLDVIRRWDLVKLAEENVTNHERIIDQIRLRSGSGVATQADLDQALGRLALASSNVVIAHTNYRDAITTFEAVVGRVPQGLSRPADAGMVPDTLEETVRIALAEHPQLHSAEADLAARREQFAVAKGFFYPVVDVELDRNWFENVDGLEGEEDEWLAMLRLRYNLYSGQAHSARKQETALLINEAEEIRNMTRRQVVESVKLSWRALEASEGRLAYLEQRAEKSRGTAQAYVKQWSIGRRTLLDVLDSEAEVLDARRELVDADFDGRRAHYRILNGMGRLVHSLGLDWPEESRVADEHTR